MRRAFSIAPDRGALRTGRAGIAGKGKKAGVRLAQMMLALLLTCLSVPATACNESTVLNLIGALEAPDGFDTVYHGVRVPPPRPITSMSVAEVLEWQRQATRGGSVSSAAGRYQVIRPTLQRLVDEGVVSPAERFDIVTQNRIGRHLLRETGYRPGASDPQTANAIARVWAALPRADGLGSVYEGIAGNHALITAPDYRAVLDCRMSVAEAATRAAAIRGRLRFGFAWDQFLEDLVRFSATATGALATAAIPLLLLMFLIDLVWRVGRQVITEGNLSRVIGDFVFRLGVVAFCMTLLLWPDAVIRFIAGTAAGLAPGQDFSLAEHAAGRIALIFSLTEGLGVQDRLIMRMILSLLPILSILLALQIGLIVFWYANLFLAGAVGLILAAFGGLKQGVPFTRAYAMHLLSAGMSLMTAMLIMAVFLDLGQAVRSTAGALAGVLALLLLEVVAIALMWYLPKSVGRVAKGMS